MTLSRFFRLSASLLLAVSITSPFYAHARTNSTDITPLILISIDGYRADYLQRGKSATLQSLREQGGYAKQMHPSFPSLTFPNHYTLVTGLRPDQHGIIANTMDDPAIPGVRFSMGNKQAVTDRKWWDQATPIWVSAERHGIPSATMFWPGSEAAIQGFRPSEWRPFDGKQSALQRVQTLLSWLDKPQTERPRFLTLYFDDVDHAGHDFGPDSTELERALLDVDRALASLLDGLRQRNLSANLVIVSDHGMAATDSSRVIYLNKLLPLLAFSLVTYGPLAGIQWQTTPAEADVSALIKRHAHMNCWNKNDIPAHLEYGRNPRVPDVLCLAEPGWLIMAEEKSNAKIMSGAHGYDNRSNAMAALFVANGPAFQSGVELDEIDNIDVYPLLMHLLRLTPEPNAGQLSKTQALLRTQ